MITQLFLKTLFTSLFLLIIWMCGKEVWHIWVPGAPVLTAFSYTKDGQLSSENGRHFAQLIRHDLTRIEMTHRRYYATVKDVLSGKKSIEPKGETAAENQNGDKPSQVARTDLRDPTTVLPVDLDLPELKETLLELEVQVYGVDVSAILRRVRRGIRQPNEITGTVSERGGTLSVYSEFRTSRWSDSGRWHTFISDAATKDSASYKLATRLFRLFAERQVHQVYALASDDDFALFVGALRNYELYQSSVAQRNGEQATKALAAAKKLIMQLSPDTAFPFTHDLAARVLYDAGEDAEIVRRHATNYLTKLTEYGLPEDPRAKSLIARLQTKIAGAVKVSELPIRRPIRPIRPGASVAHHGVTAGTLCCIVKDASGKQYLLTADHDLGLPDAVVGDPILQPAALDGGTAADRVATLTKWIRTRSDGRNTVAGGIAQLVEGIEGLNDIPGVGPINGIVDAVDVELLGEEVKIVGRTSGLVMTRVISVSMVAVIAGATGPPIRFENLIGLEAVTRGGDSGAPVLTADNELLGMVYAGSNEMTVVIPIKGILDALDVTLVD